MCLKIVVFCGVCSDGCFGLVACERGAYELATFALVLVVSAFKAFKTDGIVLVYSFACSVILPREKDIASL